MNFVFDSIFSSLYARVSPKWLSCSQKWNSPSKYEYLPQLRRVKNVCLMHGMQYQKRNFHRILSSLKITEYGYNIPKYRVRKWWHSFVVSMSCVKRSVSLLYGHMFYMHYELSAYHKITATRTISLCFTVHLWWFMFWVSWDITECSSYQEKIIIHVVQSSSVRLIDIQYPYSAPLWGFYIGHCSRLLVIFFYYMKKESSM